MAADSTIPARQPEDGRAPPSDVSTPDPPETSPNREQPLRKSISFKTQSRPSRMAVDGRESGTVQRDPALGSADERTGILGAERGGSKGYQTAGVPEDPPSLSGAGDNGQNTATLRRSKGKKRAGSSGGEESEHNHSWWSEVVEKYGSVELENKGSVARDHLALERTFLAWLRTSLSFASIGIAITQLFRLNTSIGSGSPAINSLRHVGKPLGATFIAVAIAVLFIGFHRYFESQHYIIRGKFPASRGSIMFVVFISGALIATSLAVILIMARGTSV